MFAIAFVLLSVCWITSSTLDFSSTRSMLEDVSSPYKIIDGRLGAECYGEKSGDEVTSEQSTDFLDMVNFMEYVQATTAGIPKSENFMKYYNLAEASMEHGNIYMAQEHMARATRAVETSGRKKRSTEIESPWTAAALFHQFRTTMGEEKFKQLLHLKRRVVMSFVIDTSSSMANDIAQVREYIHLLIIEQENSGVQVEYSVTTFADPLAHNAESFRTKGELIKKLNSLVPSIGGDCEEKTCSGIKKAIFSSSSFWTVHNTAMYIFTDASSKDCTREYMTISRVLHVFKASAFFILFGSCKPDSIDRHYVSIAQKSGGFVLLIKNTGIYNITDTVNGAYDKDALVYGEESDNTRSVIGQGVHGMRLKRDVEEQQYGERSILIDTSIERFKLFITATPSSVLSQVRLEKPKEGHPQLCGTLASGRENVVQKLSSADNSIVIDVTTLSCPCTGLWTLRYPREAVTFDYKVRSSGEFLVDFEAYFVDKIDSFDVSSYSPCVGIEENLVIKLNQGEKVNRDTLTAKILGLAGRVVHWMGKLKEVDQGNYAFVSSLVLPTNIGPEGFIIILEGKLVDGVKFQRSSSTHFYPTGSCLRTKDVTNYYALTPFKYTIIKLTVSNNNNYEDTYLLTCENTENYDVTVGSITYIKTPSGQYRRGKSNPALLSAGESALFSVRVSVPSNRELVRGRSVTVTCKVTTSTEVLMEMIMLTEMTERI